MKNTNCTIEQFWNSHINDVEVGGFGESLYVDLNEEEPVDFDDDLSFVIRKYNNDNEFGVFSFFDGYSKHFDASTMTLDIVNDYMEHKRISKIEREAEQRKTMLLQIAKSAGKRTNVLILRSDTLDNKKKFVHNELDNIIWRLKHKCLDTIWEWLITKRFEEITNDEIKMFRKEFFKQIKYNN